MPAEEIGSDPISILKPRHDEVTARDDRGKSVRWRIEVGEKRPAGPPLSDEDRSKRHKPEDRARIQTDELLGEYDALNLSSTSRERESRIMSGPF